MEPKFFTMLLLFLMSCFFYVYFLSRGKRYPGRLPPGSLGLPLIGQTFDLLKALKGDKVQEWFQERIAKHGPIWKAHLFGYPTVVLHGVIANKFVYTCDGNVLSNKQPPSVSRIMGMNNIGELIGDDHKRVRGALSSFLKIDVLKEYVAKVDEEIQHHLETLWRGQNEVQVQPLIKILTFNVICSLLFGIKRGPKRERLLPLFQDMIESTLAIPVNLPFTQFGRGLRARKKLVTLLLDLISEKKEALKEQKLQANPQKDLIVSLLQSNNDDSSTMMSDEEIIDNIIVVMVAGYDTTSILLTLLMRLLANNESIYSKIAQEHEEISKRKASGEGLTWEDLTKMQYTWRVASETLRIHPPLMLTFRRAAQDIEYGGYIIPKGWQVMLSASMTHNDDSIFQNPAIFDPARFEKHAPSPPPFSLVPFGAGPRMCPGFELAKMETLAMIHRLVTLFKWDLLNKDESFKRTPLPKFDQGLQVGLRPIEKNISKSYQNEM
uniref:taxadiene 5-alpha hydroxylase-like n=1 Tax=Erigeron canadensis TaxID=72917 RepID=UPI001CB95243|nr:taxadiene 5-alpha hydroxylase-like [Erigeron canadensis]